MLTLHSVRVIAKSKVNCERSFKCDFNTPHIDSAKIIYNIRMFAGAGHTLQEWEVMVRNSAGARLCINTHGKFFFALPHLHPQSLVPFRSVFDSTYRTIFEIAP